MSETGPIERAVKGEIFIFISRAAGILAMSVGAPLLLWLASHMLAAAETVSREVHEIGQQIELIKQNIDLGVNKRIDGTERELADHESRIRVLERPK